MLRRVFALAWRRLISSRRVKLLPSVFGDLIGFLRMSLLLADRLVSNWIVCPISLTRLHYGVGDNATKRDGREDVDDLKRYWHDNNLSMLDMKNARASRLCVLVAL